jgi:hypothetical protein
MQAICLVHTHGVESMRGIANEPWPRRVDGQRKGRARATRALAGCGGTFLKSVAYTVCVALYLVAR